MHHSIDTLTTHPTPVDIDPGSAGPDLSDLVRRYEAAEQQPSALPPVVARLCEATSLPPLDAEQWATLVAVAVSGGAVGELTADSFLGDLAEAGLSVPTQSISSMLDAFSPLSTMTPSASRIVTAILASAQAEAAAAGWELSIDDYYVARDFLLGVGG